MKLESKFKLLKIVPFEVPITYDSQNQILLFEQKNRKKFDYWNIGITDKNYANVSHKLEPGKRYIVYIYGINERVTEDECLKFLKSENSLFVGPQGISLFWELRKEELPMSKYTVALDEEMSLWEDPSDKIKKSAGISRSPGNRWGFQVFFSGYKLQKGSCLICFKELKK